ncbi:MAG: ethanolamine utilization microcompartment protein EutS [Sedimentibacter sp.]
MKEEIQRSIQEYVPGKQITLLHIIAQPVGELYEKLGLEKRGAIGIVTSTPGEAAIIAADVASKAANVGIGFLDRFTGSLVIYGDVASVEAGLKEINKVLNNVLNFTSCEITRS